MYDVHTQNAIMSVFLRNVILDIYTYLCNVFAYFENFMRYIIYKIHILYNIVRCERVTRICVQMCASIPAPDLSNWSVNANSLCSFLTSLIVKIISFANFFDFSTSRLSPILFIPHIVFQIIRNPNIVWISSHKCDIITK